ncbi:hypothetical protein DLAC_00315 [Tieghemostelium lacteum]|uniref:F-box domain-containing protein n=1 Tax=Tieghemostelium lacteum TaxID=361077 RepID=A0A152A9V5_TIELA|nr:hypothetical protein DLAC_00315 [Tieghemostelium lacteum]|eukprot:KYR02847.1 hypothetical protein DLAC_00315 [Tieghemostelium lacteum]
MSSHLKLPHFVIIKILNYYFYSNGFRYLKIKDLVDKLDHISLVSKLFREIVTKLHIKNIINDEVKPQNYDSLKRYLDKGLDIEISNINCTKDMVEIFSQHAISMKYDNKLHNIDNEIFPKVQSLHLFNTKMTDIILNDKPFPSLLSLTINYKYDDDTIPIQFFKCPSIDPGKFNIQSLTNLNIEPKSDSQSLMIGTTVLGSYLPNLKKLSIGTSQTTAGSSFEDLFQKLSINTTLETFILKIGATIDANWMVECINKNKTLKYLDIQAWSLVDPDNTCDIDITNDTLEYFSFDKRNVVPFRFYIFYHIWATKSNLRKLFLPMMNFQETSYLLDSIQTFHSNTVKSIDLIIYINNSVMKILACTIIEMNIPTLEQLDIKIIHELKHQIGLTFCDLCKSLKVNNHLKDLQFQTTQVNVKSLNEFIQSNHPSLTRLSLSKCFLANGAPGLANALMSNHTLKSFCFSNELTVTSVIDIIKTNRTLQSIIFLSFPIVTSAYIASFEEAIANNHVLSNIYISSISSYIKEILLKYSICMNYN